MKHMFATVSVVLIVIGGLALPVGDAIRASSAVLHRPLEPGHGDYPVPGLGERLAANPGKLPCTLDARHSEVA
jgi:hypothetical protein